MPKVSARHWLKVLDVKVERLQDISEADAIAEGIKKEYCYESVPETGEDASDWGYFDYSESGGGNTYEKCPVYSFSTLWDSTYAKKGYSWESNPYVFAYTFEGVEHE